MGARPLGPHTPAAKIKVEHPPSPGLTPMPRSSSIISLICDFCVGLYTCVEIELWEAFGQDFCRWCVEGLISLFMITVVVLIGSNDRRTLKKQNIQQNKNKQTNKTRSNLVYLFHSQNSHLGFDHCL